MFSFLRRQHRLSEADEARAKIRDELDRLPLRRISVGSAGIVEPSWIATDLPVLDVLKDSHWLAICRQNSLDAVLSEHMWEHLTEEQGAIAARNCFRYLKPGGYLRVAVPDGFHPSETYRDHVRPGGVGPGADDHKALYNYQTLHDLFLFAGFDVYLLEYFDQDGKFHYVEWDREDGFISRSSRYDRRNAGGTLNYTSLILDAKKH